MAITEVDWSIRIRPYPGEAVSGDAGVVLDRDGLTFVSLLDAAGHGVNANAVAERCKRFLTTQTGHELEELPSRVSELLDRLGIVAAFGEIDRAASVFRLVSIGNIVTRLYGDASHQFVGYGGLIRASVPPVSRTETAELSHGDTIVMHSDGVSRRARLQHLELPDDADADRIAAAIIEKFGKENDDASCLVARVYTQEKE